MPEKYTPNPSVSSSERIITNDIYLAACLLCLGSHLDRVVKNDRHRVAFVFTGEKARQFKAEYQTGTPLYVDAHSLRENINLIRVRMNESLTLRSAPCPHQSPTVLSRA